jgi:predicted Zn-dependent peptidase
MRLARHLWLLAAAGCGSAVPAARPASAPAPVAAPAPPPASDRLANGLEVRVVPCPGSGVVAVELWLQAALVDERPEERGASEVLERLVVDGGGAGGLVARVSPLGGRARGWSEPDATVFEVVAPAEALGDVLSALGAELSAAPDADAVARVGQETAARAARAAGEPSRSDLSALISLMYGAHPLARPPHGVAQAAERLPPAAVLGFRARRYGPGAALLVVAGDVDPDAVRPGAEAALGGWTGAAGPRDPLPPVSWPPGPSVQVVRRDGGSARLLLGLPLPPGDAAQAAAVDVLAVLLGQGPDSRLARAAAAEGLAAAEITAYAFRPAGPGLFVVGLTVPPTAVDAAWRLAVEQVLLATDRPPDAAELARARAAVARDARLDADTAAGRARRAGAFASRLGDGAEAAYDHALETLDPATLDATATGLLRLGALGAVVGLPAEGADPAGDAARGTAMADAARRWAAGGASPVGEAGVYRLGTRSLLLVERVPGSGTVAVQAAALGGVAADPPERPGTAAVVARLLAAESPLDGARLRGVVRPDAVLLELTAPGDEAEDALAFVARRFRRGDFAPAALDRARGEVEAALRRGRSDPDRLLRQALSAALEGPEHPAGREPLGRPEALLTLRPEEVRDWFAQHVAAAPLVIAVAGDVDPDRAAALLARGLTGRPAEVEPPPLPAPVPAPGATSLPGPGPVTRLAYGFTVGPQDEAGAARLEVLAELLAAPDGPAAVPGAEVRPSVELGRGGGEISVRVAAPPEGAPLVRAGLDAALRQMAAQAPDPARVAQARRRLVARRLLTHERGADRARWLLTRALQGAAVGPRAFAAWRAAVDAVSPDDLRRLVAELRPAEHAVVVTVGPPPPQPGPPISRATPEAAP